ncbi:MAG: hypothetical protein KGI57_02170 [Hyphomicrobiales bacterium]|nr:hypothetical protein [Hyphomicrobiales bacterium]MDE2016492.1 hypothetical protein [Hyphomicrobiales bacterium]
MAKALKKGLDHRARDKGGQIRHKRKDTMVKTLRKEYGDHFLKGYKPDATLGDVLKKEKVESLHALLKKK